MPPIFLFRQRAGLTGEIANIQVRFHGKNSPAQRNRDQAKSIGTQQSGAVLPFYFFSLVF
jgi:hypothetical protein